MTASPYRLALAAICVLAALPPPCYGRKIKTNASKNADFASYKTYHWLPVKTLAKTGVVEDDAAIAPIIREAVNKELAALGLTEVKQGGDLEVATFASTTFVPQLEAVIFPGGQALDFETPIATMGRYNKEGTFAINLIDTKSKRSVWAGMATDSITNKPGAGLKKLPSATAAMFSKYPTKKK
jgi:hypothetical protein